jgi:hypothetical protein
VCACTRYGDGVSALFFKYRYSCVMCSCASCFIMVDRGECTFVSKTRAAQAAGAIGVILVSDGDVEFSPDGGSEDCSAITIPTVIIGRPDGARLKEALASGTSVTVTLKEGVIAADRATSPSPSLSTIRDGGAASSTSGALSSGAGAGAGSAAAAGSGGAGGEVDGPAVAAPRTDTRDLPFSRIAVDVDTSRSSSSSSSGGGLAVVSTLPFGDMLVADAAPGSDPKPRQSPSRTAAPSQLFGVTAGAGSESLSAHDQWLVTVETALRSRRVPGHLCDTVVSLLREGSENSVAMARSMLEDVHVPLPPRPDTEEAPPSPSQLPQSSPRLAPMGSPLRRAASSTAVAGE